MYIILCAYISPWKIKIGKLKNLNIIIISRLKIDLNRLSFLKSENYKTIDISDFFLLIIKIN